MRHRPFLVPKRPKDRRALDEKGQKRLQPGAVHHDWLY